MEAFHFRVPTAAELEGTGFKPKHYKEPQVEVWPEGWQAFEIYMRLQNQWRCGPSGPMGLDYAVVFDELRHRGIVGEDRDTTLHYLRVVESEAIRQITED